MRSLARFSVLLLMFFIVTGILRAEGRDAAAKKIALLPWKVNSAVDMDFIKGAMADMLASRLGASAEIIRPDLVRAALDEKAALTDSSALEAGKKLKADHVLYGSVTVFGNAVSMDARLLNTATGEAAPFASEATGIESIIRLTDRLSADVLAFLDPSKTPVPAPQKTGPVTEPAAALPAKAAAVPDDFIVKPKAGTERPVAWKSSPMEGMYLAMTAADLDRDGSKEIFLVSGQKIVVGAFKADGFQVMHEIEDKTGSNIAVCSIDADKDGVPEVYISRVADNRAASAILEYRDGAYKVTASGLGWLLRTVQVGSAEPALVGQRFRQVDGFYGGIKVLKKEGTKLVEKGPFGIEVPGRVGFYGFEAFDLTGSGGLELVTLDDRQYLSVYTQKAGGKGWSSGYKSADFYGGTLNYIDMKGDSPGAADPEPVPVEGRFFHADMDGDGREELILRKNTPGGLGRSAARPASFKTGEVISLSWDKDGGTTAENWRTKPVEGYIADFLVDDLDGDGVREVTMLVVTGTGKLFGTLKSYILSHRISL